eukprot:TRINITY_DN10645_c0_g1_i1.p1 TRINITY_DN10645_c0_g1~~TRINITY_DN10645_c0_g1_i1.p1  ORF type:complete len:360 (-),score=69.81 TRINITY_DN10645_c0_g1_i1:74-1153(-)
MSYPYDYNLRYQTSNSSAPPPSQPLPGMELPSYPSSSFHGHSDQVLGVPSRYEYPHYVHSNGGYPPSTIPQQSYTLPVVQPTRSGMEYNSGTSYQTLPLPYVNDVPDTNRYSSVVTDKDEDLAKILQDVERVSYERERAQREAMERLDEQFARNLSLQSSRNVPPPPRHDPSIDKDFAIALQQQEMMEEEQRRREEAKRLRDVQRDEEIARRLAEEERRAQQIQKDKELARELQRREDQNRYRYNYEQTYTPPSYTPSRQPVLTNKKRRHAVNIHNRHCSCGETQTWNNNHILNVHAMNCSCNISYSNEGTKHKHDNRCCKQNHIHTIRCYCVFRSHTHGNLCCQKYHIHDNLCHCNIK